MTSIGQLRIDQISQVSVASLSTKDARHAGYVTKAALLADLAERDSGTLYRIDLHLEAPDPRIALREKAELTAGDTEALRSRLARFDDTSPYGPWTVRVLKIIQSSPRERAGDLALRLDLPKDWLKVAIRKLKNLGLTISHEPGYELSPRGAKLLATLSQSKRPNKAPEPTPGAVTPRANSRASKGRIGL